jgi:hypothetical protein
MRRIALAVLFSTIFAAQVARANDVSVAVEKTKDAIAEAAVSAPMPADTAKDANATNTLNLDTTLKLIAPKPGSLSGHAALVSLHVGFAGFQAYDVYSTTKAIRLGAVEANPLMRKTVGSRAALIGVKVATTAGSIFAAERLWRDRHRVAAIALMAVSNGMMAAVAAHNASVIARQARQ